MVFPKSSWIVPIAAIKYKRKRTGSSSLSSSETQATGSSLRWLQSASKVVLPKPAGAETTVKSRLVPSSSRSCRRERGTAFGTITGHVELGPEYLPVHERRFCHRGNYTRRPAKSCVPMPNAGSRSDQKGVEKGT